MNDIKFFDKLDLVDKIVSEVELLGYDVAINNLKPFLEDNIVKRYFYNKLNSADWVKPLFDNGLFDSPSNIVKEGDRISFPPWPESKYLSNVAELDPKAVAKVISNIPYCDNENIHEDFVEAAIKMPAEQSELVAKKELDWCRKTNNFYFNYPRHLAKLISHLSKSDKYDIAIQLITELLDINKNIREIGEPDTEHYHKTTDVNAKFSTWEYERVLKEYIPKLIDDDENVYVVFRLLCDLLEKAVTFESEKRERPNDYSWIWRASIEDHKQNIGESTEIKSMLVSALRDAVISIIRNNESNFDQVVDELSKRTWLIFHRIALYCITKFPELNEKLLIEKITNKDLFEDSKYKNDYFHLAHVGFKYLENDDKNKVLAWVSEGPDIEYFKSSVKEHTGNEPDQEQINKRIKYWQREKLEQFSNDLPEEWNQHYNELVKEFGKAEHPEFSSYSTSWSGPTSPLSNTDLASMSIDDLISYLTSWEPPKNEMDHSPEGLARNLISIVKENAEQYINEIDKFKDLDPTYVRGLLEGISESVKSNANLDWNSILDFCIWVVNEPREIPDRESEYSDMDPGWVWARKTIASLINENLKSGKTEIPIENRTKVWNILHPLSNDPDPTSEDEERDDGSYFSPTSLAINTVRGEAMHGMVDYGLWVYRNDKSENKTFDIATELRDVLENHLDITNDPSLAIRSVYGQRFPWINLMDKDWSKKAKNKIFNDDEPEYRDTAWNAYIKYCQPYDDVLPVLNDEYKSAIKRMNGNAEDQEKTDNINKRLAEHIFVFYWRGKLKFDDEIIREFYENASPTIAEHVINFMGRSLESSEDELPEEIETRLIELWEWRISEAEKKDNYVELSDYFWWFASGKLDDDWSLAQLKYVLSKQMNFDNLTFAADRLTDFVPSKPSDVLECLDLMIQKLSDEGFYLTWNDKAKEILERTYNSDEKKIKEYALELINKMGSHGYLDYRELLVKN